MTNAVARILDANANRAREALRMMEDAARFACNNEKLSSELKTIRHELRDVLDSFPPGWLIANRDTVHDVGTGITAPTEMQRVDLADVAIAAGKRLGEALRVLEETSKTCQCDAAAKFEQLRYRSYSAEAALTAALPSPHSTQWRICVLLTESICTRPWLDVAQAALAGGADCIQVREKHLAGGELTARVKKIIAMARQTGAQVIVNDRVDVALAAGADGVHVGQDDLSVQQVRSLAGRSLLVGVSTHTPEEAAAAINAGADYCGVGAMFTSPIKPDRTPSGIEYLSWYLAHYANTPHLAIGGIDIHNVDSLIHVGVRGIAVSTAVCSADDPKAVVQRLRSAMDATRTTASA
jgi:thiamine-phosphate pyrophosphorylase